MTHVRRETIRTIKVKPCNCAVVNLTRGVTAAAVAVLRTSRCQFDVVSEIVSGIVDKIENFACENDITDDP